MKETLLRTLMSILFLPILIFTLISSDYDSLYFTILVALIGIGAMLEMYFIFRKKNIRLNLIILLPALLLTFFIYYKKLDYFYMMGIVVFVLILSYSMQVFKADFDIVLPKTALSLFALVYAGLMLGALIKIKQISNLHFIVLLSTTWFCDIGAYFVGRGLGKHKAGLAASPNKSIEGFIGGVIISLAAGYVACYFTKLPFYWWLFVISLGTIVGDLLESVIKRYAGVKDSSRIIPGHGGILDVFDSLIFNAPIYFILLQLFG